MISVERAKKIIASPEMITVTYNGEKVFLEKIHEKKDTVIVNYLDHPENKAEVLVRDLTEITH
ncbi:H-type small acid-soluble spore protein [Terrilactibacillus tamarindi]|uniref:H-type small acid-soluble spore protein n=1 Tax=Terrilactibacillus tamarindi TaxID=2599694 RepID=UPI001E554D63|nr:H-type small acid-soluble spore protein [Terrilactibacillus tamarindi]